MDARGFDTSPTILPVEGSDVSYYRPCLPSLYGQAISHPHPGEVWGPGHQFKNMLHLGPIHDCVTAHYCRTVIANNPGLLLSSESDSGAWNRDGAVAGAGQGGPGNSREEQKQQASKGARRRKRRPG
ncbi:hypothetical protein FPV67DRAFT_1494565 [Lyophyllum atratum]|nr:hypothetical protein FPV67DRAFT_1494565 [Lyophyllum atratum]